MTRFDFSPLFRSTVGFDRLFQLLDSAAATGEAAGDYPPCNIEQAGDDHYRLTMAVAGLGPNDIEIEYRANMLTVSGNTGQDEKDANYLYRGIGNRAFRRSFQLADHVKVTDAHLADGMLRIDLVRALPEAMKPRRISIKTGMPEKITRKAKKLVEGLTKAA